MIDTNLVFNSNAIISGNTLSAIVDVGKFPAGGCWVEILHTGVVGGSPATGAQLTASLEYSDSSSFAGENPERGPDIVRAQNTAAFRRAVLVQSRRRYARVRYAVTGTSPSFTGIYTHVRSGPQRDDAPGVNTN